MTPIRRCPRHAKAYSNQAIIKWELDDLNGVCTDWRLAFDLEDQDSVQQVRNECKLRVSKLRFTSASLGIIKHINH